MAVLLALLGALALLAIYTLHTVLSFRRVWGSIDLPSPKASSWILGHVFQLLDSHKRHELFEDWFTECGCDAYKIRLGPAIHVHVRAGLDNEAVMKGSNNRTKLLEAVDDAFNFGSESLFTALSKEKWSPHVVPVRRFFKGKSLDAHLERLLYPKLTQLCEVIDAKGNEPFNANNVTAALTLDFICHALGRSQQDALGGSVEGLQLLEDLKAYMASFRYVLGNPHFHRMWWNPAVKELYRLKKKMHAVCADVLANARARRESADYDPSQPSLADVILDIKGPGGEAKCESRRLTDVLAMLIAGYDTTALTLGFVLHLIGTHPDAQHKLQQEIDAIEHISVAQKPPYMWAVVKEALRLAPVAGGGLYRAAIKPVQLATNNAVVPGGGRVEMNVCVYSAHTHTGNFGPDAQSFNPDRWLPGGDEERRGPEHGMRMLAFGYGPRSCIGRPLAEAELTLALATLLRRYTFTAVDAELELATDLTLFPVNGVWLRAQRRDCLSASA